MGDVWSLNQLKASAVAQSLMTLNLERSAAETDIAAVLRVLECTVMSLPVPYDAYHVACHPSVTPLIASALTSSSVEAAQLAIRLLDYIGSFVDMPGDYKDKPTGIGDQLGCTVIQS
ncbi:hypothetical protein FRB95_011208 [Tulasnella sp. JGI-2019a]|nr:hypothetical protein FRB95_011208 [Tulasnella sp. JGI-2019a]